VFEAYNSFQSITPSITIKSTLYGGFWK
jgi:hypothetical protein